jgi:hypothetical protein
MKIAARIIQRVLYRIFAWIHFPKKTRISKDRGHHDEADFACSRRQGARETIYIEQCDPKKLVKIYRTDLGKMKTNRYRIIL